MAITNTHTATGSNYINDLLSNLRALEDYVPTPYYDRATTNTLGEYQNVTIGDGINIDWSNEAHLKLVLNKLGMVDYSNNQEAIRRQTNGLPPETVAEKVQRLDAMVSAFQQVFVNNRPAEDASFSEVQTANQRLGAALDTLAQQYGGLSQFQLTETQSQDVITRIIEGGVTVPDFLDFPVEKGLQAMLDARLGNTDTTTNLAHDSKEYAAVMSMYYNAKTTVGKHLVTAIKSDNRAEAWFEMRYNTNRSGWNEINGGDTTAINSQGGAGLAKRRYAEAQLFGLYGDTTDPAVQLEDAKSAYRMLQLHRDTILTYESWYGQNPDGTSGQRDMTGAANADTLAEAFTQAKEQIITTLNTSGSLTLNKASYLSTDIYLDPGRANSRQRVNPDYSNKNITGSERNDILIGEGGSDTLIGGAGNDVLIGGNLTKDGVIEDHGIDILKGGTGNDTYLVGRGDRISDTGGINEVNTVLHNGVGIDGTYTHITGTEFYQRDDGIRFHIDEAGTAHFSDSHVSIENFDPSSFGITYVDSEAPVTINTLSGDNKSNYLIGSRTDLLGSHTIHGGAGQDYILGSFESDILHGDDNDDWIVGNGGEDLIYGDGGNDYITSVFGGSTVYGGIGDDIISAINFDAIAKSVINPKISPWISNEIFWQDTSAVFFHPANAFNADQHGYSDILITSGFTYTYDPSNIILKPIEGASAAGDGWTYKMSIDHNNTWSYTYYHADHAPKGEILSDSFGHYMAPYPLTQGVTLSGGIGNDTIIGNDGADNLSGGDDNDNILGNGGEDLIDGGKGDDIILAGDGDDYVMGQAGKDFIRGGKGNDTLDGGDNNDYLYGGDDNDLILGGDGNDILWGGRGIDYLAGGKGNDTYVYEIGDGEVHIFDTADDLNVLQLGEGITTGMIKLEVGSLAIRLSDTDVIHLDNFDPNNPDAGASGITRIEFADGTVMTYQELLALGFDQVGTSGDDIINGTPLPDNLYGLEGNDTIYGLEHNDYIDGGTGADTMAGGAGDDTYLVDQAGDTIVELANEGNDTVIASYSYSLQDNVENLVLNGSAAITGTGNAQNNVIQGNELDNTLSGLGGNDTLYGGDGNDVLDGGEGDDTLSGGTGDDILDGGAGVDVMIGGAGADIYIVDNSNDVATEDTPDDGIDTVRSSVTYQLDNSAIERLELVGDADIDGTGNNYDNEIVGNSGNNRLDGRGGADTLAGGDGDDTYVVDQSDTVIEVAGEGTDTVEARFDYTLGSNLENLTLTGYGSLNGTGNELDNVLRGNSYNNILDGQGGADTMVGGAGDDTYIVDNTGDTVVENAGDGIDTVYSSANFTLSANVENLTLTGNDALSGSGNALNNVILGNDADNTLWGNDGNDSLSGGLGADVMHGGAGDDVFFVDHIGDITQENSGEGYDRVYASVDHTLGDHIERLYLTGTTGMEDINGTGNNQANTLYGNAGDNVLSGLGGDDILDGGSGNDTLDGGDGNDTLNGRDGADTLIGGNGDDQYIIDNINDVAIETGTDGYDSVLSSVSFTMGENIEAIELLFGSGNLNATGNASDNYIIGNEGDNILYGLGGDDTIDGDAGNDTLLGGDGNDHLYGGDDQYGFYYSYGGNYGYGGYVYGPLPNNDTLDGGAGDDYLDGGSGDDILYGREGDDYLFGGMDATASGGGYGYGGYGYGGSDVSTNNDRLYGGEGNDVIDGGSGDDFLYGEVGTDTLYGGDGIDLLDGGDGIDTMSGGQGNDTYVVDGSYTKVPATELNDCGDIVNTERLQWTTDSVTEYAGEGFDTVLSNASFVLGDNIERLELVYDETNLDAQTIADLQTFGMDGTGNAQDNQLIGNALKNRLDGGVGADTMEGGAGDDTYVIDNTGDIIIEASGGGNDTVESSLDYSLTDANLENLTLLDGATTGQGNAGDNILRGNSADNLLEGLDGNDRFYGGAGNDTLMGGAGDDTYIFRLGDGNDIIDDNQGADTLYIGKDLTAADLEGERVGNDAVIRIIGTDDSIALKDWFLNAEGVNRISFCDSSALDQAGIEGLFNQPPVANPDSMTAFEDGGIVITPTSTLLANDTDPNPTDILTVESVGASAIGATVALVDGEVHYDIGDRFQELKAGAVVYDSFVYTINDGNGATATSTVTVTIVGTNDGPVAEVDFGAAVEDGPVVTLTAAELMANDHDIDQGDTMSIASVSAQSAAGATVSLVNGDVQYDIGDLFQELAEGQIATDTFEYTIIDSAGATSTATVTMTITGTNDAPVVTADTAAMQEDVTLTATGNVLANDSDIDQGDILTVANAGTYVGQYGTLTLNVDGSYNYALYNSAIAVQSLAEGQLVSESFDYITTDGMAETASTLTVNIIGTNDAPVVNIPLSDQAAYEEVTFSYQIPADTFSDIDQGDTLSYSATLANGDPLPDWLTFDPATRTLSSNLPDGKAAGIWDIRVTATDLHGASAYSDFKLDVADLLKGTCEEETLTGSGLRDVIYGFGDDDILIGSGANDVLIGGTGQDILQGGEGDDILIAEDPIDAVQLEGAPLLDPPDCCGDDDDDHHQGHRHQHEHHGKHDHGHHGNDDGGHCSSHDDSHHGKENDDHHGKDYGQQHDGHYTSLKGWPFGGIFAWSCNSGNKHHYGEQYGSHHHHDGSDGHCGDSHDGCGEVAPAPNLLDAGAGNDKLYGGAGNDILIGGSGNDTIDTGAGANLIAFNVGDGNDIVLTNTEADNTLSMGGGIELSDLAFSKAGDDLVLEIGDNESITLNDWYASEQNHNIVTLQIISEAKSRCHGHDWGWGSHHDKTPGLDVLSIDFSALTESFAESGVTDHWSLTEAKLKHHLEHHNSEDDIGGGDLAGQYALHGSFDGMSYDAMQDALKDANLGDKRRHGSFR